MCVANFSKWFLRKVDRSSWMFLISSIFMTYICGIFFFGLLYYLMENYFDWGNASVYSTKHCIYHIEVDDEGNATNSTISLIGVLQFAFETQSTIGYGHHYVIDECYAAVFVVWCQYITINIVLDPILAGLVFRKIMRPLEVREKRMSQEYASYAQGVMTRIAKDVKVITDLDVTIPHSKREKKM